MELRGESQPNWLLAAPLLHPMSYCHNKDQNLPFLSSQAPALEESLAHPKAMSRRDGEVQGASCFIFTHAAPDAASTPTCSQSLFCGREAQNLTAVLFCSEQPMICVVSPPQSFLSPQSDPWRPQLSYRVSDTCLPVLGSDRSPKCRL